MARRSLAWITIALVLEAHAVHADALSVTADENGSWESAVAMLQADVHGEGRTLHVRVTDSAGDDLACGEYTLVLDEVAAGAFEVGACDASSGATAVRLNHRSALFDENDVVPVPRLAGISAVQVRRGGARGGARRAGASEVVCSVAVRPYLEDLEHARHVFLQPGRFVLRPVGAGVTATVVADGWVLRGSNAAGALSVEYEVVDTRNGETVVHTHAALQCAAHEGSLASAGGETSDSPAQTPLASPASIAACTGLPSLDPDHAIRATAGHGTRPTDYVIRVDRMRHLLIDVSGDFDGDADLYAGCGTDRAHQATLHLAPESGVLHSVTLAPGLYSIRVENRDRRPNVGAFSMRLQFSQHDPESHFH